MSGEIELDEGPRRRDIDGADLLWRLEDLQRRKIHLVIKNYLTEGVWHVKASCPPRYGYDYDYPDLMRHDLVAAVRDVHEQILTGVRAAR